MSGIIKADKVTEDFLKPITEKPYEIFQSDEDANYHSKYEFNVKDIEPLVAKPHSPDNRDTVKNVSGTKITKCYIGSCTGGKITDYRAAAKILINNRVKISTFIIPASTSVAKQLETETYQDKTLKEIFESSGCIIVESSCAACLGGPVDTTGRSVDNDVVISTTNRNFPGRMGSKKSEVYLASPLTVAASAVNGVITDPRIFLD
jgi:3-isopropylmalate/(R)-2-methylmalate dehydratase large subunit